MVRQTIRKRLQAKLHEVKAELRRRLHAPIPEVGTWLGRLSVDTRYYGVPMNWPALFTFRFQVGWLWHRALARRGHTGTSPGSGCAGSSSGGCPLRAFVTRIP